VKRQAAPNLLAPGEMELHSAIKDVTAKMTFCSHRRQTSEVRGPQLNPSATEPCGLFNKAGSKNKEFYRLLIPELFITRLFAGAS